MPNESTIRRMHIEELDAIQDLYAQQSAADADPLAKLRVNPKQHAWEMKRIRQQWLAAQKYLPYIACLGDTIVGYAAATIERQAHLYEIETVANLGELWVLPDYRRRGIGRALVEELLRAIDQYGISWVSVHLPCDDALQNFFAQFGFTPSAREMQLDLSTVPTD